VTLEVTLQPREAILKRCGTLDDAPTR